MFIKGYLAFVLVLSVFTSLVDGQPSRPTWEGPGVDLAREKRGTGPGAQSPFICNRTLCRNPCWCNDPCPGNGAQTCCFKREECTCCTGRVTLIPGV